MAENTKAFNEVSVNTFIEMIGDYLHTALNDAAEQAEVRGTSDVYRIPQISFSVEMRFNELFVHVLNH